MKLGLRDANQHFSKAMKAVRAGQDVVLTERGKPIAVITPIRHKSPQAAALAQMADEGLITLPTRRGPLSRFVPARRKGRSLSQTVLDDRADRA